MPTLPPPTADIATDGLDIESTAQSEQPEIKHIRVYLTGYGPFRSITNNPSFGITESFLPTTTIDINHTPHLTLRITLQPHPSAVRVAYADVDTLIPEIYDTESFDYILHVGVGLPGGYELEKIAHGDGYCMGDVDGKVPGGEKAKTDEALKKEGLLHHWGGDGSGGTGKGEQMGTGLDVDWIVEMVQDGKIKLTENSENDKSQYTAVVVTEQEEQPDTKPATTRRKVPKRNAAMANKKKETTPKPGYQIRASSDAGRYLCEYIFRKSLEQAISRRKKGARKPWNWHNDTPSSTTDAHEKENISKRVLFMHVPPTGNIYSIPDGIDCLKKVVVGIVLDGEGLRSK